MSGFGDVFVKQTGGSSTTNNYGTSIPGDTVAVDPTFIVYREAIDIPDNMQTEVLSYTVPAMPIVHSLFIQFGGQNVADFVLEIDGIVQSRAVTYWGSGMEGMWDFRTGRGGGVQLPSGKIVRVLVTHESPSLATFWARINCININ